MRELTQVKYSFVNIDKCNMCLSPSVEHKVLGRRMNQPQGFNPRNKAGATTTIMKCSECSLIYSNPRPVPKNILDHYGVLPENYWKPEYFNADCEGFDYEIGLLKNMVGAKSRIRALDVGAGIGKYMKALEASGIDAYGLEASEPFCKAAVEKTGIEPSRLKVSTMEKAGYEENYFDFVNLSAVLEHVEDPSDALRRSLSWLKPDGLMHVEVPSSRWLTNALINLYYRLILTDYVTNLSPMHNPYHLYEYSLESFRRNSVLNNYGLVFSEYYLGQTFLPVILDPIIKPIMKMTNTGMQLSIWIKKNR